MTTQQLIDIPLPRLAPQLPLVTQWRASRGDEYRVGYTKRSTRRIRLGWSPQEVSDLIDMPLRTVHHYREQNIVVPSVVLPQRGIDKPIYGSGELIALRFVADLREAGLSRELAEQAASEVAQFVALDLDHVWSLDALANFAPMWLLPTSDAGAQALRELGVVLFCDDHEEIDREIRDAELAEHPMAIYRAADRCSTLIERVAHWWSRIGTAVEDRPPWM